MAERSRMSSNAREGRKLTSARSGPVALVLHFGGHVSGGMGAVDEAVDQRIVVGDRLGEQDGREYHFVDRAGFEAMMRDGALLESALVFDNYYGTPRAPVEEALAAGRDMLFDVDWQGAKQVRERLGDDVVSIFVLPPSMRELRARLERRAEDSAASIGTRLEAARQEIGRWRNYQFVIVNDDLQRAYGDVVAIVTAERLRAGRVEAGIEQLVESGNARVSIRRHSGIVLVIVLQRYGVFRVPVVVQVGDRLVAGEAAGSGHERIEGMCG